MRVKTDCLFNLKCFFSKAILLGILLSCYSHSAFSASEVNYHGRILKSDNTPISGSVDFILEVRSSGAENCLLYSETQTKTVTDGVFSLTLGTGSRTDSTGYAFEAVFANRGTFNLPTQCTAPAISWTPASTAGRKLFVSFKDSTMMSFEAMPSQALNMVPQAIDSQTLGGYASGDFLKILNSGSVSLTQSNLQAAFTGTAYTNLQAIMSGNFVGMTSGAGASLPSVAANPSTPAVGSIWYNSSDNTLKYYDGAVRTISSASYSISGVTSTADVTLNGSASGSITSGSVAIGLADTGVSAGSYAKVTVDTKGRVTAGSTLSQTDIPTLTTAGKVDGSAITGAISVSGAIATSSSVTAASMSTRTFDLYDSDNTNRIRFLTPATGVLTADYQLVFPSSAGGAGQVLATDGSGNLSWTTATSGAVTTIGSFSGTSTANGLSVSGNSVFLHAADGTNPGAVSTSAQTIAGAKTFTSEVTLADQKELRLSEASGGGTDYVGIRAPAVMGAPYSLTLPAADGSANQSLVTNGSGTLSWASFMAYVAPSTSGNVLTSDGSNWVSSALPVATTASVGVMRVGTGLAVTTSGTVSGDFGAAAGKVTEGNDKRLNPAPIITDAYKVVRQNATGDGYEVITAAALMGSANVFVQDGNSFGGTATIGTNDGNQLRLETSGVARMTVDTTGNVGIGTTNPSVLFNVVGGNGKFEHTNGTVEINPGDGAVEVYRAGGDPFIDLKNGSSDDFDIRLQQTGGNGFMMVAGTGGVRMLIDNSGNMGIGTTSPGAKLHVMEEVRVGGSTSGYVGIRAPAVAGSGSLTLPSTIGASGQVMVTDGSGVLSWASVGASGAPATSVLAIDGSAATPSIAFSADTNTGLFRPGTDTIAISTSGVEALRVNPSGFLGVGTTNPGARLEVGGDFRWGTSASPEGQLTNDGTNAYIDARKTGGSLIMRTNGSTEAMRINSSGNVGIGTSAPFTSALEVRKNSSGGAPTTSGSADAEVVHRIRNTSVALDTGVMANGNIWLQNRNVTDFSVNYPLLLNPNGGYVGIGVTTPDTSLHLKAPSQYAGFAISGNTSNWVASITGLSATNDNGLLRLYDSGVARIYIVASGNSYVNGGNLGIGTTNPSAKLHVAGGDLRLDGSTSGYVGLRAPAVAGSGILTLPATVGSSGQVMVTDGSGVLSWGSVGVSGAPATSVLASDGSAATPSIAFSADTNTGLFRPGNDTIAISTSGVEALRVNPSGFVGIGTTNPLSNLHVTGSNSSTSGLARFVTNDYVDSSTGSGLLIRTGASSGNTFTTLNALSGGFSTGNNLILQNAGNNVGIGTTNPQYKLEVLGNVTSTSSTQYSGLRVTNGVNFVADILGFSATNDNGGIKLYNSGAVGVQMLANGTSFFTGGNVGIGTTTPTRDLHVSSSAGTSVGIRIENTAVGGQTYSIFSTNNTSGIGGGKFGIYDDTNVVPRFVIDSSGNIGIGTSNPSSKLQVTGDFRLDGSTSGYVGLRAPAVAGSGILTLPATVGSSGQVMVTDGSGVLSWASVGASGSPATSVLATDGSAATPSIAFSADTNTGLWRPGADTIAVSTSGVEALRVNASGNMGIGTTSPLARLHVTGTAFSAQDNGIFEFEDASRNGMSAGYDTTNNWAWFYPRTVGVSPRTLAIFSSSASTPSLVINTSGNLGIGTTGPTEKLEVAGNIKLNQAGGKAYTMATDSNAFFLRDDTNTRYPFKINAGAYDNAIVISASGNVGFGSTTASDRIHVSGGNLRVDNSTNAAITFWGGGSYYGGIGTVAGLSSSGSNTDIAIVADTARAIRMYTSGASNERMTISSTGNVGIGTTAPSAKLHVMEEVRVGGSTSGYVGIRAPAVAGSGVLTLPATVGSSGQVMVTDGSGVLSWSSVGASGAAANSVLAIDGSAATPSIAFSADTNTGLWRPGTDTIAVSTSGVERMRIDASGNMGVGTTAPATPIETVGAIHAHDSGQIDNAYNGLIRVTRAASTGQYINLIRNGHIPWSIGTVYNSSTFAIGQGQSTDSNFNAPFFNITSTGNVGIGTTTPGSKLQVFASTGRQFNANPWADLASNSAGQTFVGNNAYIDYSTNSFYYSNTHASIGARGLAINYPAWGDQTFVTVNGSATAGSTFTPTSLLTVSATGNVGIGTTSPGSRLEVIGASGNGVPAIIIKPDNAAGINYVVQRASDGAGTAEIGTSTNHNLSFITNNTAKMHINSSGYVGIGTTGPNARLEVAGGDIRINGSTSGYVGLRAPAVAGSGILTLPATVGSSGQTLVTDGSGVLSWVTASGSGSGFPVALGSSGSPSMNFTGDTNTGIYSPGADIIAVSTSGVERMRINASGNMGIGTTSPVAQSKLTVTGSISANGADGDFAQGGNRTFMDLAGTVGRFGTAVGGGSATETAFWANNAEVIRLNASSNVGIGTTSPGSKLTVAGSIESTVGGFKFPDGTVQTTSAVSASNNSMISGFPDIIICTVDTHGPRPFHLTHAPYIGNSQYYYRPVAAETNYDLRFDASGNFAGIDNATTSDCNVSITALRAAGKAFNIIKGPAAQWMSGSGSSAYYNAGNVGIGTSAPVDTLDVRGNLKIGSTANSGILAFGDITSAANSSGAGLYIGRGIDASSILSVGGFGGIAFHVGDTPGSPTGRKMSIDVSGNVGIGTTAPSSLLHIESVDSSASTSGSAAMLRIANTSTADNRATLRLQKADAVSGTRYGDVRVNNSGLMEFATGTSAGQLQTVRMAIDSSGNIGMGTTAPGAKLHVMEEVRVGGSTSGYVGIRAPAVAGSGSLTLPSTVGTSGQVMATNGSGVLSWITPSAGSGSSQWTTSGSHIGYLTGSVGVGTTAPSAKLDITANRGYGVRVWDGSNAGGSIGLMTASDDPGVGYLVHNLYLNSGGSWAVDNSGSGSNSMKMDTAGNFKFYGQASGSTEPPERMRISGTGNVGIGTTAPGAKLHVMEEVRVGGSTSGYVGIRAPAVAGSGSLTLPSTVGTSGQVMVTDGSGVLSWASVSASGASSGPFPLGTSGAPSITFSGDSNTGIYSPGADLIAIATSGVERMRFNGASVGIGTGTSTPFERLDVLGYGIHIGADWATGTARTASADKGGYISSPHYTSGEEGLGMIYGHSSTSANAVYIGGGTSNVNSATDIRFMTAANNTTTTGTARMTINSSGYVGIGTTSPTMLLDLSSNDTMGTTIGLNNTDTGGRYYRLRSYGSSASGIGAGKFAIIDASASVARLVIDPSGNIGIGTTGPTKPLSIYKDTSNGTIQQTLSLDIGSAAYNGAGTGNVIGFYVSSGTRMFGGVGGYTDGTYYGTGLWGGVNGSSITGAPTLLVSQSSFVGIGTTTPGAKLDVKDTIRISGSTSGYVELKAAAAAGSTTYTLPSADGSANAVLVTNGSGVLSWSTSTSASSSTLGVGSSGSPSLTFSGDTDTGFYNAGANQIGITTSGVQRFTVSASGLVSPTTGGAAVTSGSGSAASPTYGFAGDAGLGWFRPTTATLAAATSGIERMRIDPSGYVGIGTSTPSARLHVAGSGGTDTLAGHFAGTGTGLTYMDVRSTNTNDSSGALVRLITTSAADTVDTSADIVKYNSGLFAISNHETSAAATTVFNQGGSERMRINSSGYVGIGSTNPTTQLEVGGTITSRVPHGALSLSVISSGTSYINIYNSAASSGSKNLRFGNNGGNLTFEHVNDAYTVSTERVRIDTSGNMGIGTTAPDAKLHVADASLAEVRAEIKNSSSGNVARLGLRGPTASYAWYVPDNANYMALYDFFAGAERMRFDSSGNIGIGSTNPVFSGAYSGMNLHSGNSGTAIKMTNPSTGITATDGFDIMINSAGGVNIWNRESSYIRFATSGDERMRIDVSGNVGIGTTNPLAMLDVNGGIRARQGSGVGAGGTYIGFAPGVGELPGYPTNSFPVIKTDGNYIYFVIANTYAGYMDSGGVLHAVSDRERKENFTPIDKQDILSRIDQLEMTRWNYKEQGSDVQHIAPIAQDFHRLFGLAGKDNTKISSIDPAGIALVGVQALSTQTKELYGLCQASGRQLKDLEARVSAQGRDIASLKTEFNQKNFEKDERIKKLEEENARLKERLDKIEQKLNSK